MSTSTARRGGDATAREAARLCGSSPRARFLRRREREDAEAVVLEPVPPDDHRDRLADAVAELVRVVLGAEAELDGHEHGVGHDGQPTAGALRLEARAGQR